MPVDTTGNIEVSYESLNHSLDSIVQGQRRIELLRRLYEKSTVVTDERSETRIAKALRTVLDLVVGPRTQAERRNGLSERALLEKESKLGASVFPEIPASHRREFFYHDNEWIWYEEAINEQTNKKQVTTVRYQVQSDQVLKTSEGLKYSYLEGEELDRFTLAAALSIQLIQNEMPEYQPFATQYELAA